MPTKEVILQLLSEGESYESVARQLGINPGQAYLTATGLPADGSDSLAPEERQRPGIRWGSTQQLVNPPTHPSSKPEEALAWLRKRAASVSTMKGAAQRRDAAPPPLELPEEEDELFDVLDVLGRDHNQVKYLLEQLETLKPYSKGGSEQNASRRQSIVDMITVALAGHESAEEALFWPAVTGWLGPVEGEELAKRATTQEQEGKETLAELEGMAGTEERFDELVERLSSQLRKHVALEDLVFVKVRAATEKEARVELGRRIVKFERHAPTRPHAKAGSSPRTTKLAPTLGAADKARDALGGRPARRRGRSADEDTDELS